MPDGFIPSLSALVDSGKRTLKQKLADLLSNPTPYLQQTAGQVNEDAKSFNRTSLAAALGDPMAKSKLQSSMLDTAMNFAPALTVWHGSPHKFSKFDMSKIGTGEGAQAYGHGLYMAQNKAVADEYAGKLSKPIVSFPTGVDSSNVSNLSPEAASVVKRMQEIAETTQYGSKSEQAGKVFFGAPERVQGELSGNAPRWSAFDILDTGSLYKSDIPDEAVARFLDWDKPLSQQAPEVQKALSHDPRATDKFYANGGEYYRALMARKSQDAPLHMGANAAEEWAWPMATDQLRSAGVPGIRYLDGGSRAAGQGSSNFVLFDDQLPRILEINGAPTGLQPWKPGEWK